MITLENENEITRYLTLKKLNKGLLLEIKDHFMLQISDLMEEAGIGFQEAFLTTKLNWQHELELVRADVFSFRKIARIEKEALQIRFRNIVGCAMASSLLLFMLICMIPESFIYLQMTSLVIFGLLLGYNFIFRKMRLYDYLQLSFHPLILRNALLGAVIFGGAWLFFNEVTAESLPITKLFFLYAMSTKIQLLYKSAKRVNVLV
ncbi:MAG: hypothetical protein LBE92_13600 [Chryseobacterium sp.]|jgi:hypothetical protein|uniref:hypothetical protein n=1 Tax=Chryseobacterium sp. TaxID=1871047 RepID=UPI0028240FB9|nr:hypothetical protein [Chryseobacterium sp.]MDR2237151.1 hypothetical protein [Chryseobacterium sp.]